LHLLLKGFVGYTFLFFIHFYVCSQLVFSIKFGGVYFCLADIYMYQDTYRHEVIYIYEVCACIFMLLYDCAGQ